MAKWRMGKIGCGGDGITSSAKLDVLSVAQQIGKRRESDFRDDLRAGVGVSWIGRVQEPGLSGVGRLTATALSPMSAFKALRVKADEPYQNHDALPRPKRSGVNRWSRPFHSSCPQSALGRLTRSVSYRWSAANPVLTLLPFCKIGQKVRSAKRLALPTPQY